MKNKEIRDVIATHRVRYYEVAEVLGISECTFSRWMRRELTEDKRKLIIDAINKLVSLRAVT